MSRKHIPGEELLAEVEWLLDGGMHPLYIITAVERSPQAIAKAAWRAGNKRVEYAFNKTEVWHVSRHNIAS